VGRPSSMVSILAADSSVGQRGCLVCTTPLGGPWCRWCRRSSRCPPADPATAASRSSAAPRLSRPCAAARPIQIRGEARPRSPAPHDLLEPVQLPCTSSTLGATASSTKSLTPVVDEVLDQSADRCNRDRAAPRREESRMSTPLRAARGEEPPRRPCAGRGRAGRWQARAPPRRPGAQLACASPAALYRWAARSPSRLDRFQNMLARFVWAMSPLLTPVSELFAENLAVGSWQRIDEADLLRALEAGQPGLADAQSLGGGRDPALLHTNATTSSPSAGPSCRPPRLGHLRIAYSTPDLRDRVEPPRMTGPSCVDD